ncbi:hypothetical protein CDL12_09694 [Handroanthus impetiginosus]|uniref:Uncharacterized protein n=1 Tax=Handroanthus impetiginosus TaxID=429701 RepID=A0A2G9HJF4_9LAMI|nr:hypothetical protein CDL12_09694 [Handroanthus impetiginosus]
MEPASPAITHQDSSHVPQSSTNSNSTEQVPRAGHMGPELGRTECEHFRVDFPLQHPQPHPYLFCPTHSPNMHKAIQIEIEKERIRGAIIMSEIVRRRIEAEVRGNLMMMDKELDLQRANNGFPFGMFPLMGIKLKGSLEDGKIETSPFRRGAADLRISEVMPVPVKEGAKEKEKIILLAKLDENISGSERSIVTPPPKRDVNKFPSDGVSKKKAKVEWSCGLCQVHGNNECVLNQHLQGKKHKAKEAENISRSERSTVTLPPREDVNASSSDGLLNMKAKVEWSGGLYQVHGNNERDLNQHLQEKKHRANEAENIFGSERSIVTPPLKWDVNESPSDGILKMKAKVEWSCGLCQVHGNNEQNLNQHLQGKKHKTKEAENISESERSSVMPPPRENINGSPLDSALKKEAKLKWSCGLCQAHGNNERDLNQHLQGKKHKAKEVENICGSERSAVTLPLKGDVNESSSDGILRKKTKVEWTCRLCQVHGNNEHVLNQHLQGKKHKAKAAENISGLEMSAIMPPPRGDVNESSSDGILKKKAKVKWSCGLCQVYGNNERYLNQHLHGKKHKAKLAENISESERSSVMPPPRGNVNESPSDSALKKKAKVKWSCGLCQAHGFNERDLNQHLQGKKHKAKEAENISESERSDVMPPPRGNVNESLSDGILKKKAKVEWSCGLCQVHGNNDRDLNKHLQGKKHQAKEAENISELERSAVMPLSIQDVNESSSDDALKKKAEVEWSCDFWQVHGNNERDLNKHLEGKKHKAKEAENISGSKRSTVNPSPREDANESSSDGPLKKKANVEWSCGLCQVYGNNERTLNQHLQGKKHNAKQVENISESERSVVTPPPRGDVNESPSDGILKKKVRVEWSCGLCQVHGNNEHDLNQHLQGKKHKAKEAENIYGSERSGVTPPPREDVNESPSDGALKKKAKVEWSCGLCQVHGNNERDLNQHIQGKKHQAKEAENISESKSSTVTSPLRGDVNESPLDCIFKKAKVEWSCGLCQIHGNNERDLNKHLQGKKHKAKQAKNIS